MSPENKILIGMDVSGDSKDRSNYKFLGIVMGTQESIMSLSENIGSQYPEHMSKIMDKDGVLDKLSFDSKNRIAFCVKLDREKIVNEFDSIKIRRRKIRKSDILRTFERVVMQEVGRRIQNFALLHKVSITDVTIQCDKDSEFFARAGNLQYVRKGVAYRLSDYVAWCNNRKMDDKIDEIIPIDITDQIPNRMKSILKLN